MFTLDSFLAQLSILLGWTGLMEWRIRVMQSQINEKIKDREELTKYKIDELKVDLGRLESKIDHLITIQLEEIKDHGKTRN